MKKMNYEKPVLDEAQFGAFVAGSSTSNWDGSDSKPSDPKGNCPFDRFVQENLSFPVIVIKCVNSIRFLQIAEI